MTFSPETIRASYAACRRVCRRAGSNFPAAFLLLPRAKRQAMDALYAFFRHSDDLVDAPESGCSAVEGLGAWREALERALRMGTDSERGVVPVSIPRPSAFVNPLGATLLPAVADTVGRFQVPPDCLRAVLDGVEMDLSRRRYETFDELAGYCERVASAVGLACVHVWGFTDSRATAPARSAGIALQLTNILRDIGEDARQERVYLPAEDLRRFGYTVEDLQAGVVNLAFQQLMEWETQRAERFYREAEPLLGWLAPDGRRIYGMMIATYRGLLRKIRARPGDVFKRRVRLSWPKKLRIVVRWAIFPPAASPRRTE